MKAQIWGVVGSDPEVLGYIPDIFLESDPRPAVEQANDRYAHGGGWHKFCGSDTKGRKCFTLNIEEHAKDTNLQYPDDPPMMLLGFTLLHPDDEDTYEAIYVFESSWVVIQRSDDSWECARMD